MATIADMGSLVVRVGLDDKKFDQGLKNVNRRMALAKSELRASSSMFTNFGKTVDGLRLKQQNLSKQYQLQGVRVQQLRNQYKELAAAHGAESDTVLRAAAKYNNALATYNKMGHELQGVTKELRFQESRWYKASSSLKSFSDQANKVGGAMTSTGRSLTMGVTMPIAGIATAAIRTGMQFDKQMSKVQAISGATGKDFDALRKQARDLGAGTQFSARRNWPVAGKLAA
ncbi:phage tail tape measure protein [Numidum massiliense]|uniref:phage tail tape measure protein n=1 Tax=Numidum massiliense TaxID=1522315 RepID=UPI0006D55B39|nr:phage tail tape measure protein [Numidum massiliense]